MILKPKWLYNPEIKQLISTFGADNIRFVGGAVRDAVLGIEAKDIDIATIFSPTETMSILEKSGIRAIPTGFAHGTVTALINGKSFQITSLRADKSCDGRHALVVFTNDWRQDAARRDFTINALYMNENGDVVDYFEGIKNIKEGKIYFIGDASSRIKEDFLRILRFFRFLAFYGKESPDKLALDSCSKLAYNIESLSGERIQKEILKLLEAPSPFATIELMQKYEIFKYIFGFSVPSLQGEYIDKKNIKITLNRLAFLLLNADIPPLAALEKIRKRWKISCEMHKNLSLIINNYNKITPDTPTNKQKQLIRKIGNNKFTDIVKFKNELDENENYNKMLYLSEHWQVPIFPVSGNDLLNKGLAQGKNIGETLRNIEKTWEESDYSLSKSELLNF